MTTIDNLSVTAEQAKQQIKQSIAHLGGRLDDAEDLAGAAGEILNNPAFIEATRLIQERAVGLFFASTLNDTALRNRAYVLNMMHQLYLAELRTMVDTPRQIAEDMDALRERYEQLESLC